MVVLRPESSGLVVCAGKRYSEGRRTRQREKGGVVLEPRALPPLAGYVLDQQGIPARLEHLHGSELQVAERPELEDLLGVC
jgi:hypothetical protein